MRHASVWSVVGLIGCRVQRRESGDGHIVELQIHDRISLAKRVGWAELVWGVADEKGS